MMNLSPRDRELFDAITYLVEESPDNTYPPHYHGMVGGCYYSQGQCSNGSVGCLIGQALLRAGYTGDLSALDIGERTGANDILPQLGYGPDITTFANCIQDKQDSEIQWGVAYRFALKYMAELE